MDIPETPDSLAQNRNLRYLTLSSLLSLFFCILSFFIMMNAISVKNEEKFGNIATNIKQEFKEEKIEQKLSLFQKRKYEKGVGEFSVTFNDLISSFLANQKKNVASELVETPNNFKIKLDILNFYGSDNNKKRPNADIFILSLNNFLTLNKKSATATAKLVMPYDSENADNTKNVNIRIRQLYKILAKAKHKNISFSTVPLSDKDDKTEINNIYVFFSKDEF